MVEGLRDLAPFFFPYVPELVPPSVDRLWAGLWWLSVLLLSNPHHSWRQTCFSRTRDGWKGKEAEYCRFSAALEDADKTHSECSWTCDETIRPATGAEDWFWNIPAIQCSLLHSLAGLQSSDSSVMRQPEDVRVYVTHPCNSNRKLLLLCVTCRLSFKSTSMISASKFVI